MSPVCPVDVGPASMLVGNLVAGKRIAQATGRELGVVEDQDLIRKVPHSIVTDSKQLVTYCVFEMMILTHFHYKVPE